MRKGREWRNARREGEGRQGRRGRQVGDRGNRVAVAYLPFAFFVLTCHLLTPSALPETAFNRLVAACVRVVDLFAREELRCAGGRAHRTLHCEVLRARETDAAGAVHPKVRALPSPSLSSPPPSFGPLQDVNPPLPLPSPTFTQSEGRDPPLHSPPQLRPLEAKQLPSLLNQLPELLFDCLL